MGSSLSTIVVFLPFALLPGVTGAFFKPLALTMVLALLASFFLSAFAVPVATRLLERRRKTRGGDDEEEDPTTEADDVGSRRAGQTGATTGATRTTPPRPAPWTVRWSRRAVGWWPVAALVLVGLGAGGYLLVKALDTDFLPAMDEGSIILDYWTPPGTSLAETTGMLREVERVIQSIPDVAGYSRRTGTQLGFFITEPNRGDYVIELEPRKQRRPVDEVIADLRSKIAAVEPAVQTDFGQLLEDNIGDLTGGVPQPIEIKVFGEDQATLRRTAKKVASIAESVQGVEDVFDGITISGPDPAHRAEAGGAVAPEPDHRGPPPGRPDRPRRHRRRRPADRRAGLRRAGLHPGRAATSPGSTCSPPTARPSRSPTWPPSRPAPRKRRSTGTT